VQSRRSRHALKLKSKATDTLLPDSVIGFFATHQREPQTLRTTTTQSPGGTSVDNGHWTRLSRYNFLDEASLQSGCTAPSLAGTNIAEARMTRNVTHTDKSVISRDLQIQDEGPGQGHCGSDRRQSGSTWSSEAKERL
jgi:hypothetical protein